MTLKQYISFLYRIDQIQTRIRQFDSGQPYIDYKDLTQLANIKEAARIGRAYQSCHSAWSVHNMVQIQRITETRDYVMTLWNQLTDQEADVIEGR